MNEHDADEQPFAADFRRAYDETPAPAEQARARILAATRAAGRPRRLFLADWLAPRTFTLRPLTAIAAAMVLFALGVMVATQLGGGLFHDDRPAPEVAVAPAAGSARPVRFVFADGTAASVALVGDFNGWDAAATPLARGRAGAGQWSVSVALPPGWHSYAFVVDGEVWRLDPQAPLAPPDEFGEPRSVIVVEEGV